MADELEGIVKRNCLNCAFASDYIPNRGRLFNCKAQHKLVKGSEAKTCTVPYQAKQEDTYQVRRTA